MLIRFRNVLGAADARQQVVNVAFTVVFLSLLQDYGGSSTVKYQQAGYTPSFSSKSSFGYSASRTMVSPADFWNWFKMVETSSQPGPASADWIQG